MEESERDAVFVALHSDEVLFTILAQIENHVQILRCCQVKRLWNKIGSQETIWSLLCRRLWKDKAYVPDKFQELSGSGKSLRAFRDSILDSKRCAISAEEISLFSFYFRFKASAGQFWTAQDPYWVTGSPLRVHFSSGGLIAEQPAIRWAFIDRNGNATPGADGGNLLRVAVLDQLIPTYEVFRLFNWGFVLQATCPLKDSFRCPSRVATSFR